MSTIEVVMLRLKREQAQLMKAVTAGRMSGTVRLHVKDGRVLQCDFKPSRSSSENLHPDAKSA